MRRFFAGRDQFSGGSVELEPDETRHLRDVLRLREGDDVNVFDGEGKEYLCRIETVGKKQSSLTILGETEPSSPESSLDLTLAATILPGDKYDLVVLKAVELGVITFIPLITRRCEAKLKDSQKKVGRWNRIVMEASKQSGRARLMKIDAPAEFGELAETLNGRLAIMFSEREGGALPESAGGEKLTALVGPKGGWDDLELKLGRECGLTVVTLGGRILRAETAAIALTAILQHRFGDMN